MAAPPISPSSLIHPSRIPNRWIQLIAGIVAMMAIANLQYAWTLFTKPIQAHLHVSGSGPVDLYLIRLARNLARPFRGIPRRSNRPQIHVGYGLDYGCPGLDRLWPR